MPGTLRFGSFETTDITRERGGYVSRKAGSWRVGHGASCQLRLTPHGYSTFVSTIGGTNTRNMFKQISVRTTF